MICFYLLWTLCYLSLLAWMSVKWPRERPEIAYGIAKPPVTLLISLRNEIGNLEGLVQELGKVRYPNLEILLIDDHSGDGTFAELKEKTKTDPRISVLQSPGEGKKAAITFGLETAKTELILCSDADCSFPELWVERMLAPFADPKVQLVAGPVMALGQMTFFQRFQQIEWASVLLTTQFLFSQKKPMMCSAANLAYRKSAFLEVRGYDQNLQHLSGDDEFLLKKIVARFGAEAGVYLAFRENLVFTQPQATFLDMLSQRVRWASKWRLHGDWRHALAALLPGIAQLVWLASPCLLWLGKFGLLTFAVVWVGKMAAERLALGKTLQALGCRLSLGDFAKTSLVHPLYVVATAAGAVRGKFSWKGRAN